MIVDGKPLIIQTRIQILLIIFHGLRDNHGFYIASTIVVQKFRDKGKLCGFKDRLNTRDIAKSIVVCDVVVIGQFEDHEPIINVEQLGKGKLISEANGRPNALLLILKPREVEVSFSLASPDVDDIIVHHLCLLLAIQISEPYCCIADSIDNGCIGLQLNSRENSCLFIDCIEGAIKFVLLAQRIMAEEIKLRKVAVLEGSSKNEE
jgi:hypothetical protein